MDTKRMLAYVFVSMGTAKTRKRSYFLEKNERILSVFRILRAHSAEKSVVSFI